MKLIPPTKAPRFWFDTEFIEDGHTIELLSIGIVRDDGAELYLENSEAHWPDANKWVAENVLPKLQAWEYHHLTVGKRPAGPMPGQPAPNCWMPHSEIRNRILQFCGTKPEFWAYYADYDWVVLCQLFGKMIDLPETWPMFCMDFKQVLNSIGNPHMPKPDDAHNALADAKWVRDCWMDLIHGDFLERHKADGTLLVFPVNFTVRDALRLAHPVQSTAP